MNQQQVRRNFTRVRSREDLKSPPKRVARKAARRTNLIEYKNNVGLVENVEHPPVTSITIGDYVLSEINPANCLCQAFNTINRKEYVCRVVPVSKYNTVISPYYLVDSHEHINRIIEMMVKDKFAYLIFENSYGDLHSYLRLKKKLKEEETRRLFKQIVDVVKHCHSVGIALRDLKLRKFVFKDVERTQLKLESLDDAHIITNESSDILHDKHGCPAYVAPEILQQTSTGYSARMADIWSLGVMVYTMHCGRYPFHDQDPAALFAKIKHASYMICEPISPVGRCFIHSILRKQPYERLTADELAEHPWFHAPTQSLRARTDLTPRRSDQMVPELSPEVKFPL